MALTLEHCLWQPQTQPRAVPASPALDSFGRSLEGLEIPNIHNLTLQKLTNLSHM